MPDQTVSGVTAGDSGGLGRPRTFFSSYSAGSLSFDFTAPYTLPSTLSVAFYFGGQQVIAGGAGDQAKLGRGAVTNAALNFEPIGFDSLQFSRTKIYKSAANSGAAVDFFFTQSYTPPYPPYAPFSFGGQLVLTRATVGVQTAFGKPALDVRQRIDLQDGIGGIASQLAIGRARVAGQPSLNFFFVDAYAPASALNTPFYFGGQVVVSTIGADSSRFGVPALEAPATIAPVGIIPGAFGRAGLRLEGANGVGVDFLFTDPYTAPPATDVPFVFPFRSLEGIARISVSAQVRGQSAQLSGSAVVNTTATGFFIPRADLRAVAVIGAAATADLTYQPRVEVSGFTQSGIGQPSVTFAVRRLYPRSTTPLVFGTHIVGYRIQPVTVSSIFFDPPASQFGIASVKDALQTIYPIGADWATFGTTDVFRDEQTIEPKGFLGALFGDTYSDLWKRYVRPEAIDEKYESAHYLYNDRQYVDHTRKDLLLYLERYNEIVTGYGSPEVVNRNKTIAPFTRPSGLRIGEFLEVRNKARLIKPNTIGVIPVDKPMVSFRVRTLPVFGFDSSEYSNRALVYNAAFQIITKGNDFGVVSPLEFIESNLRTISGVSAGNWPLPQPSTPFVAYRIRTVNVETRAGAVYGGIRSTYSSGLPTVQLWTQYITPLPPPPPPTVGFPAPFYQGGFGAAYLVARINKITISFGFLTDFGTADVRNKTRQLFVLGRPTKAEYGINTVWFRVRTINLIYEGIPSQAAVADRNYTVVSFRTRRLNLTGRGIGPIRITNLHKVRNNTPEPPVDQWIYVTNPTGQGYGYPQNLLAGPNPVDGHPTVTANSLFPEGWDSFVFGEARVDGQMILPIWDWPDSEFSWGIPVLNPKLIIRPRQIPEQNLGATQGVGGPHRVDPQTIYCYYPVTVQASLNHPQSSPFVLVNKWEVNERFGRTVTTLKYQTLRHYHAREPATGIFRDIGPYFSDENRVELGRRTLYVTGIEPEYLGYPVMSPFELEIFPPTFNKAYLLEDPEDRTESEIGTHRVFGRGDEVTDVQTIGGGGYLATLFGTQRVELFNRKVFPQGFLSTVFGNNTPMVHYPRVVTSVGNVMSIYGTTLVTYRVRSVFPVGWGQFETGDSPNFFNSRIRVRYGTIRVKPAGLAATTYGASGVRNAQQVIRAFQIAPPRCGVSHDLALH